MEDPSQLPDENDYETPRWVKVSGAIGLVILLLFVVVLIVHGPHRAMSHFRHSPSTAQPTQP